MEDSTPIVTYRESLTLQNQHERVAYIQLCTARLAEDRSQWDDLDRPAKEPITQAYNALADKLNAIRS